MKKGTFDARDFAVDEAMDMVKGLLIVISAIALPLLTLLGILGYTSWLIQPNGVARTFFWIFLVIYLFWLLVTRFVYKRIKRAAENAAKRIVG